MTLGLLLLPFWACGSDGALNTGTVMELRPERMCISVQAPGGLDKKCFRLDDATELGDGVDRGDFVEVRFVHGEALSVKAIQSPE